MEGVALEENIVTARWRKCLWNAAFNPLSVVMGGKTVNEILDAAEPRVRALMQEVAQIAAACGHRLPSDAIEKMVANTKKMAAYKPSMLADYEAGRLTEIEAILGEPIRVAGQKRISTPELERLYGEMKRVANLHE